MLFGYNTDTLKVVEMCITKEANNHDCLAVLNQYLPCILVINQRYTLKSSIYQTKVSTGPARHLFRFDIVDGRKRKILARLFSNESFL